MSEYTLVEKPFLDQLVALGWQVVDQGQGIPSDPSKSFRTNFREILLPEIFSTSVRAINTTEDDRPWLTDKQLDELRDDVLHQPGANLLEANANVLKLLYRAQVDLNELTGEEYPNVKLIDFQHPERNQFLAINQFRVDTPGSGKKFIIPDIVLFVNGLPLVVIECKDATKVQANPLYEAFKQLMRYANLREDTEHSGLQEGEPRLFYPNQLLIRTSGEYAEFGTITATQEEYFFSWKDIWPESYKNYDPPLGKEHQNERQQEILIQGMLATDTLLDIIRTCTVFMTTESGHTVKVVSRYQQYRAVTKIIAQLRGGQTPAERSGVVWHTQGSGKSLTMVFAIRKLRMCDDLKDLKVCLINDRRDLENQLAATAALTDEKVTTITSTAALKKQLATDASNLNMVMVHKFQEVQNLNLPDYLESVLDHIPEFKNFEVVNPSERIVLMIDEAHRSQAGDMGGNLSSAFPNATRLAFTGTPLIVVNKDKKTTKDRFGHYIDTYKLQDAVGDGTTVQILYEGKTADSAIKNKSQFDAKVEEHFESYVSAQLRKAQNVEVLEQMVKRQQRPFDDLVRERTDEEILALKHKWGTLGDIMEADKRIKEIATDLVNHYIDKILPNGFKAQVVCSTKLAAVKYKKYIDQALATRLADEQSKPDADSDLCRKIAFLKSAVVISPGETNESKNIVQARKYGESVNATENFKRAFDFDNPDKTNTGIAFLIVCDMLLTGFDAPIEQVMYIDKKIQDHTLLQTIARVNRVAKEKTCGYIVDYIGLAQHLKKALSIYSSDENEIQDDLQASLKDLTVELPILESRYQRLLQLFTENGVRRIQDFVEQTVPDQAASDLAETSKILEQAVHAMADIRQRANFEVYLKQFMQSLDIILPHAAATPYKIPAKRLGFILDKIRKRYKDDSLNFSGAGEKVKQLIDEHLISLGIDPKIPPVELFSPNFIQEVEKNTSSQAKASEMEHAIRKHCTVHFDEDPALYKRLSEKLESVLQRYKDDWEQLCLHLLPFHTDVQGSRQRDIADIFFDHICTIAFGSEPVPGAHRAAMQDLVNNLLRLLRSSVGIVNFWNNAPEVSRLKGQLSEPLLLSGIDEVIAHYEQLQTEIMALAKTQHQKLTQ
jgi:type I restriction enzyme R subunit